MIPLDASSTENNGWRRTPQGSPDFSHIQYVEIHADTWDHGFTLWVDGVSFDPQPCIPCEGDFNNDKIVDDSDLAVFTEDFGRTDCGSEPDCEGDFNSDNDVDGSDLAAFAAEFWRMDCP